ASPPDRRNQRLSFSRRKRSTLALKFRSTFFDLLACPCCAHQIRKFCMYRALVLFPVIIASALAATGCGSSPAANIKTVDAKYHLADEPADAVEILDAKEQAKDG